MIYSETGSTTFPIKSMAPEFTSLSTNIKGRFIFILKPIGPRAATIVAAVASSSLNKWIDTKTVFIGEVGLTGEVRGISQLEIRLKEASKLGFKNALVPEVNKERMHGDSDMKVVGVSSVKDVLSIVSGSERSG